VSETQSNVEAYCLGQQAEGKAKSTLKWSRQRLDQFTRWLNAEGLPIETLTAGGLEAYVAGLYGRGLSPHTVNGHRKLLSQFFRWCVQRGSLPHDLTAGWQFKQPRPPDPEAKSIRLEDVGMLLEACEQSIPPREVRDVALVRLLFSTGMRAGEVTDLRLRDVRFDDGRCVVFIRQAKGGKHRRAYPSPGDAQALRDWLEARPESDDDHVFLCSNGAQYGDWHGFTYWGLYQTVHRLAERAGVQVSPHGFRHGFAIQYLDSGGNLSTLSDLLGHSDIRVTKLYYGTYESGRLANAAEQHSPGKALDRHLEEEKMHQLWLPTVEPNQGTVCPLVGESPSNGKSR
jgi:integrase/recombinase XerD